MTETPIELVAGDARALVSPLGAELRCWDVGDRALLWPGDPASWPDRAPVLFPIVGWARGGCIRSGGASYEMPVHGFARDLPFAVVRREAARLRLSAFASPATRLRYPFDWRLDLDYALTATTLDAAITVHNLGAAPMPYACGLHPGFRWPFDGGAAEDYSIDFEQAEEPRVPVIAEGGLFAADTRPIPLSGTRLPLHPALLAAEALCFLHARSSRLRFGRRDGAAIMVTLEEFPHVALWSRAPGAFLCIESWTGHGDPEGFAADIAEKPSQRLLAGGGTARHRAQFSFNPA